MSVNPLSPYVHKLNSGRVKTNPQTFIGESGRLFFSEETGEIRISDGITPYGHPIYSGNSNNAGALIISGVSDIDLSGHKAVIATATGYNYADNLNNNHINRVIGLTTGASKQGTAAQVITSGEISGLYDLTVGGILYLSTDGNLTQIPPTVGFIQQLAIATSATNAVIAIQPSILLT